VATTVCSRSPTRPSTSANTRAAVKGACSRPARAGYARSSTRATARRRTTRTVPNDCEIGRAQRSGPPEDSATERPRKGGTPQSGGSRLRAGLTASDRAASELPAEGLSGSEEDDRGVGGGSPSPIAQHQPAPTPGLTQDVRVAAGSRPVSRTWWLWDGRRPRARGARRSRPAPSVSLAEL